MEEGTSRYSCSSMGQAPMLQDPMFGSGFEHSPPLLGREQETSQVPVNVIYEEPLFDQLNVKEFIPFPRTPEDNAYSHSTAVRIKNLFYVQLKDGSRLFYGSEPPGERTEPSHIPSQQLLCLGGNVQMCHLVSPPPPPPPYRAAHSIWGQTIKEYMNIDTSPSMLALAETLMKGSSDDQTLCFPGVYFRQFLPVSPKVKFDLVVSAYSLNELPGHAERMEALRTLWRKTDGYLVLVENGTKEGHQMLMEARDLILHGEDRVVYDPRRPHIFAPCPHHLPCPRLLRDRPVPCNFTQKYQPLPFKWNPPQEEEKFFYLIFSRGPGKSTEPWPRITQPVVWCSQHAHVHLCCPDGTLQHAVITAKKHGRDLYQCARRSHCGDRLPVLNPVGNPALEAAEEKETEEEKSPLDKDQS